MSTNTNTAVRRPLPDDVIDVSAGHKFVAPNEILIKSLGYLQVLTSGYLFDDRSYTSLYNDSLTNGWDKLFINRRERLKTQKSENSVIKCFLLNRLLYQYYQDPNAFIQETKCLHDEIDLRMRSDFPSWEAKDLFREIQNWRDMESRRHLFYFRYKSNDQTSNLSSFLMLQKAMTRWCLHLIQYCRQNIAYWDSEGRRRFIELFEHSLIIVAQPTGSDGVPFTHYTRNSFGQSAKLNARVISLLNPDVLRNHIKLLNINVTLCSLKQENKQNRLNQTPIVWQTQEIMSADGEQMSIYYAEVHNLIVEYPFASRNNILNKSSLCQLEFQTTIHLIFDHSDTNNPILEHNIGLISQPFGISSHSMYFAETTAKVFLNKVEEIVAKKRRNIDPDVLTEYTCRYFIRMLGIEIKAYTVRFIREVFSTAFEDVKNKTTTSTLKLLVETRLVQLINQIKYLVDYPVLTMMYDDSLFLGICDNWEVDGMLKGTLETPHILLRFESLFTQPWNESPEVRCIIHNGTPTKSCFSKKAFIDDVCRFIYESESEKAKQTVVFCYSIGHTQYDFQRYNNKAISIISNIKPPEESVYKPLIPSLWQLRAMMSQLRIDNNSQPSSNSSSIEFLQSSKSNLNNGSLAITSTTDQQDLQNNTICFTFQVTVPVVVNMKPEDIAHYLEEKLKELCEDQGRSLSETGSNEQLQPITWITDVTDPDGYPSTNELDDYLYGPLEARTLQTDSQFDVVDDVIQKAS